MQHQSVRTDFPALEPVEETHPQEIGFHLAARDNKRRYGSLDKFPDSKAVDRQPRRARMPAGRLDIDIVGQQFQRQSGRPRGLVGEDDRRSAGVDDH